MAFTAFHTCDHCGKILDDMKDYPNIDIDICCQTVSCDLCNDCVDELAKVVEAFAQKGGADDV